MESKKCAICSAHCELKCSKCNNINYCSKEHQKQHWNTHKKGCNPFKIDYDPYKGRILIATKNIDTASTIFKEESLVNLPYVDEDNGRIDNVCVSCCKVMEYVNCCSKCSWPVCGTPCESAKVHTTYECNIFSSNNIRPDMNGSCFLLQVLRCLLLKRNDPKKYELMMSLDSHAKERAEDMRWSMMNMFTISAIKEICGIQEFHEDEITEVLGIISTNVLSQMTDVREKQNLRLSAHLYEKACITSHSCVPNARPLIQNSGNLKLISTRPIQADEEITIAYSNLMVGTIERQKNCGRYYFSCTCPRCVDPTEMETHFSSVKCLKCSDGYLVPRYQHMGDSGDHTNRWECDSCSDSKSENDILELLSPIQRQIDQNSGRTDYSMATVSDFEEIIDKYKDKILHRNHYLLFTLEYGLMEIMHNMISLVQAFILSLSIKELQYLKKKLVTVGRKLLKLVEKVLPGPRLIRGRILFFLCTGLSDETVMKEIGRYIAGNQKLRRCPIPESIKELKLAALEAIRILSLEPYGSDDEKFAEALQKLMGVLPSE